LDARASSFREARWRLSPLSGNDRLVPYAPRQ
jgi:hypothetical protein